MKYRRYVSIVCPWGYEPHALPLRHPGYKCLSFDVTYASFCKAGELEYIPAVCFDHTSSPL